MDAQPSSSLHARTQDGPDSIDTSIPLVDVVEVEVYGRENRPPPPAKAYKVKIDHDHHLFQARRVTGRDLLVKAGKTPPEHYEIEKRVHGGTYLAIGLDQVVDLGEPGIEVFETFPLDETEG